MTDVMKDLAARLAALPDPEETRKRALEDWVAAIHALFRQVEGWIQPLIEAGVGSAEIALEESPSEPRPWRVRIERPVLTLQVKSWTLRFHPTALDEHRPLGWVELDIVGKHPSFGKYWLAHQGEGRWSLRGGPSKLDLPFDEESLAALLTRLCLPSEPIPTEPG